MSGQNQHQVGLRDGRAGQAREAEPGFALPDILGKIRVVKGETRPLLPQQLDDPNRRTFPEIGHLLLIGRSQRKNL